MGDLLPGKEFGAQLPPPPAPLSLPVARTTLFIPRVDASGLGLRELGLATGAGWHRGEGGQRGRGGCPMVIFTVGNERVLVGRSLQPE